MGFLIFAVALAAISILIIYRRHAPKTDPVKTVDSFQKAINALDPARRTQRGASGRGKQRPDGSRR